jgi:hypothetical protein
MNEFFDVGVFAAYHSGAGQWSIVAPAVRELSGRHGIRRIARVSERSLWRHRSLPGAIISFCDCHAATSATLWRLTCG